MNKEEITKLITDTVAKLTSNATSPHRHTGTDSLRIKISDTIIPAGVGIPFINGNQQYNTYISDSFGGVQAFVIEPGTSFISGTPEENTSSFYLGAGGALAGRVFGNINMYANGLESPTRIYQEASSTDTNLISSIETRPEQIAMTTDVINFLASNSGTFAIQFPDVGLPTPVAGRMAFQGGTFYACEVTGTWRTVVTAP
jgi:hypothetical protein